MIYTLEESIQIPADDIEVTGDLHVPEKATGIVVFSHGSGSSRLSSRNRYVARRLEEDNLATLLFDLLTEEEDMVFENRFDIKLLTQRLVKVTQWLQSQEETKDLAIGYFGSSTGAASALQAAAKLGDQIKAVVSRGGRPDMAIPVMPEVKAPTLLIVGGLDTEVIDLNQEAFDVMEATRKMEIIEGASHLFEEEGKLEKVAELAADWFKIYLK